uniref:HK97-gp10 family putative phage morphogenesis protein n=1 Tax=Streptococcus mutans TaxID=1309 RepID=UPI00081C0C4D|nr:HK97-gp10 family putative phage morphogenesis protein [Streptococcus mutans]
MDFEKEINNWLNTVQNISDLSLSEKEKITSAGAEVFRERLEKETREKHYSKHKDPICGHMADNITVQTKGNNGGVATVGWENHYHANNAMFLNDGTKKIKADHFVTNLQNSDEVKQKVFEAEKEIYDQIIERRGNAINN